MRKLILAAALLAMTTAAPGFAQSPPARTEVIQFEPGSASKVTIGSVKGYDVIDYVISAHAGQKMTVSLTSNLASNYFNVSLKDSEQALYNSSINGNSFSDVLPADGDYVIRVYLMRNDARRNKVAQYKLTTELAAPPRP